MIKYLITITLVSANIFLTADARIYLTHGFNASYTDWYQPGGDFYEALKKTATDAGHSIEHFTWDQTYCGYFTSEHTFAGMMLASKIINFCNEYTYSPEYPNDHEIIIIAHSYGGLVAYHASQTLANFLITIKKEDAKKDYGVYRWFKKVWKALSHPWKPSMPQPIISKLCTLGTPHQESDILPHPQGVLAIYNLFSLADWVAYEPVAGKPFLPQSLLMHHKAAYNVQMLGSTNEIIHGFGHSEIHHPAIAAHIFDIMNEADGSAMQTPQPKNIPYTIVMPEAD